MLTAGVGATFLGNQAAENPTGAAVVGGALLGSAAINSYLGRCGGTCTSLPLLAFVASYQSLQSLVTLAGAVGHSWLLWDAFLRTHEIVFAVVVVSLTKTNIQTPWDVSTMMRVYQLMMFNWH